VTMNGTKYVVDEQGRKKAVLMDIKEYNRIMERLEELEDTLEVDTARHNPQQFRNYRDIGKELEKEGKL